MAARPDERSIVPRRDGASQPDSRLSPDPVWTARRKWRASSNPPKRWRHETGVSLSTVGRWWLLTERCVRVTNVIVLERPAVTRG
jgi:hypothetical protein